MLTNDSRWSRALTDPKKAVPKTYLVGTEREIPEQLIRKFAEGVALPGDGVWTRPSQLELLGSTSCRLTLYEGRHHQIKRMFALWKIKVTALHRERVGDYFLAPDHALGAVREVEPLVGCR